VRLPGWPRPATLCFGLARWLPCLRSRWLWQLPRYTRDYHSRCGNGYGKLPAPLDAPNRARSKEIFPAGVQVQLRPTGLQPWHFPAAPISALSPFEKPGSWEWMQGKKEPAIIFGGTGGRILSNGRKDGPVRPLRILTGKFQRQLSGGWGTQ